MTESLSRFIDFDREDNEIQERGLAKFASPFTERPWGKSVWIRYSDEYGSSDIIEPSINTIQFRGVNFTVGWPATIVVSGQKAHQVGPVTISTVGLHESIDAIIMDLMPPSWLTPVAEATTIEVDPSIELFTDLKSLLSSADYDLDEVMDSTFSRELTRVIIRGGKTIIHKLNEIINQDFLLPEVVFDTLRLIGDIKDSETSKSRARLLVSQLKHSSRWIRDGAALGLASLEDTSALPALKEAVANEPIADLEKDLQSIVAYLETVGE